jgi:GT2 family glycosyltransferase
MYSVLRKIYSFGRAVLPIGWRRAIRRRINVDRLFRVAESETGHPEVEAVEEEELLGRPDVIFLAPSAGGLPEVAARLSALGARVFVGAPPGFVPVPAGAKLISVGSGDPDAVEKAFEEVANRFLIREACLVPGDEAWRGAAERLRSRFGWELLKGQPPGNGKSLLTDFAALFPKVSILIVTFNNLELNRGCLGSILTRTSWPSLEILFVDNGSSDGTREWLEKQAGSMPGLVRLIANSENRGFGPAANQGLAAARGEFVCLLNNDTVVTRGWLSTLVGHLRRDRRIGMIGPSTNEIMNEGKVRVAYRNPAELAGWARRFVQANSGTTLTVPMLAMFCVVFRKSLFEEVGPLDERFEIGMFEDDDYSYRVRQAGYDLVCARDAFIHHQSRGSFAKLGEDRYLEIFRENERRFLDKWKLASRQYWSGEVLPARLADTDGAFVFLPSIGWDIALVQRPHYLARTLAKAGRLVVYDCTCRFNPDDRFLGFREIEPSLFLYRGPARPLAAIRNPFLWCYPYNVPDLPAWPGARLIYDIIDDLGVFPYPEKFLRRNHRYALEKAFRVFAVSDPLLAQARTVRPDAVYLPNGVETSRFESVDESLVPPELRKLKSSGRPIAGYVGSLSRWRDLSLLEEMARACPEWDFVLIGVSLDQAYERSGLRRIPNVFFLGPVPHAAVPAALSLFDVGIEPFVATEMMRASSPLKLYEYLAAGKPIVSTPLPEMTAFPEVLIAASAEEWKHALTTALERSRDASFRKRLRGLARENDWSGRGEKILETLV